MVSARGYDRRARRRARGGARARAGVAPLPVEARKRCIFAIECADAPEEGAAAPPPPTAPLTVDPSGVYFRPDGEREGRYICGVSPDEADDPPRASLAELAVTAADHALFDERIWPALYARVPAFEALRVRSAWAGFYEYNAVDQNGVVGRHPEIANFVVAAGFSGHGLQHAPGVGRAVAELLVHERFRTIDLSALCFERLLEPVRPLRERNIV